MYIHRFSGINCCTCVLGIGFSAKSGQKKTEVTLGDAGRDIQPGPGSAKMRVGRRGNGSLESQETGMEEPLGVGSPS